ncbi:MAG: peptidoglycan editing factor PgeF [Salinisphaera sp.]|nr:peptidoglycan editing factor PgeF [Salinisphaera sp.]
MNPQTDFLAADWPAPAHIRAGTTLRSGGVSVVPYDCLNLGAHTDDDRSSVAENRRRLRAGLGLSSEPAWLEQIHATNVADADQAIAAPADASVGTHVDAICTVLTADCLPVVFCDRAGRCWGAAHAGWRGLAAGVLEATIATLPARPADLMAWLGPAIGPKRFEVGAEVRATFVDGHADDFSAFVEGARPGKFMADIYALARARLRRVGVDKVYGGGLCTVEDGTRFYSYRRESSTGRMATLIWSAR